LKTFYLIIDESGAKGYSENTENNSQEFGVMVGFLIPSKYLMDWKFKSKEIFGINTDEKIHITSLNQAEQHKLRNTLYNIFLQSGINWFYEAIYVQGFHEGAYSKELLHAKLFSSVFMKALYNLTLLKENGSIRIHVISDPLNDGEIKLFKKEVQNLIKIITNNDIKKDLTIFNKNTNQLIKGTSVTKITKKDKNFPEFENIQLEISTEGTALTLMADILANSVFYYLKKYIKNTKNYSRLNTKQAIENHPLSKLVLGSPDINNDKALPDIFDILYRKRKEHNKTE